MVLVSFLDMTVMLFLVFFFQCESVSGVSLILAACVILVQYPFLGVSSMAVLLVASRLAVCVMTAW